MSGSYTPILVALAVAAATLIVLGLVRRGTGFGQWLRLRRVESVDARRSEERFRALVAASAQLVWTMDAEGQFVEAQPEWEEYTGQSLAEYHGHGWLKRVHPMERQQTARLWEQAVRSPAPFITEYRLLRHDGEWRTSLMRAVPVLKPGGAVREWVGTVTDITERRQAQLAQAVLADSGRVLASSLGYEETLHAAAELVVPRLADWCVIDVVTDTGAIRRVAVAHPDPTCVRLAHELHERYPADPDAPNGVHEVLRTGRSVLVTTITDEALERDARDPEHLRILRKLGLSSFIIVPLQARGQILGALTLFTAISGRHYSETDLPVAEELAQRIAAAVDHARLYREAETNRHQLEEQAAELEEAQAGLEAANDEMHRANDALQQTNHELRQRTADLEHARRAAEEANAAKSQFLATMSHELRTPLNAIGGYAELLEMGVRGPITDRQKEDLQRIQHNQQHLLGLINDVLSFAKLESGQIMLAPREVPLNEVLSSMRAQVEPQLQAKQLTYEYRPGDPGVRVWADRERVDQVLLNLLSNAIKFTAPGGKIVLDWEVAGENALIRVADTGRGINPETLKHIFEPFMQAEAVLTRENEGVGLGLPISRDLARAMNGELSAESTTGEGSTFTFRLPLVRATSTATSAPQHSPD